MRSTLITLGASTIAMLPFHTMAMDDHHATVQPGTLTWTAPAAYAKGAQFTVVRGDPTKEGMYVVRLKVPAGFRIAPHTHPNDENVTVLSGSFNIGTGEKFDDTKTVMVQAGGYSFVARAMTHYAWFGEDTVIQLHGMGPQGIKYVNASDDPRNAPRY
jgi:hypothetical protein